MTSSSVRVCYHDLTWDRSVNHTFIGHMAGQREAERECSFSVSDFKTCVDFALEEHDRVRSEILGFGVGLKFVNEVEVGAILLVSFDL